MVLAAFADAELAQLLCYFVSDNDTRADADIEMLCQLYQVYITDLRFYFCCSRLEVLQATQVLISPKTFTQG